MGVGGQHEERDGLGAGGRKNPAAAARPAPEPYWSGKASVRAGQLPRRVRLPYRLCSVSPPSSRAFWMGRLSTTALLDPEEIPSQVPLISLVVPSSVLIFAT